jgi:tRNA(Ile)-lysidine synthase
LAAPDQKLTLSQFSARLKVLCPDLSAEKSIAVALSGGGDSMALAWLLSRWAARYRVRLHALTVDHGLRAEAAAEAKQAAEWVACWEVTHKILKWRGDKPKTRIQEAARKARYRLLSDYCRKNKIKYLFLAHQANDQAETILFRFAKGSGLDGLAGMAPLQEYENAVTLVRPLLDVTHESLIQTCKAARISWIEDISNVSDLYARVRIRKSMEVLGAEGLTVKRILTIGSRLDRARKALEQLTEKSWEISVLSMDTKRIVFNKSLFFSQPDDIMIRLVMKALRLLRPGKPYPPRLESLEAIIADLHTQGDKFKAATLGGCIIRLHSKKNVMTVERENIVLP